MDTITKRRGRRIGTLARQAGVHVETVRFYERIGLIDPPARSRGRQRLYEEAHMRQLAFVRRARALGFSLEEIRTLMALAAGGSGCDAFRSAAERHLEEIGAQIRELQRVEALLADAVARCPGGDAPECPVRDALLGEAG